MAPHALAVPSHPDANALVHGYRTRIARVPENAAALKEREREAFQCLRPQDHWQAWLSDDVALMQLRLERCARVERRERDRIALRAATRWDDDRRTEAEEQGARLGQDPARVVDRLRKTPQGCDWLIGRWELLADEVARGRGWAEAHVALAFDLLGRPRDFRAELPLAPADLARREVEALRDRRAAVADADALDREMAMADLSDGSSPELRRLRRHEATLHKRMRWDLHQMTVPPRSGRPNGELRYLYDFEPAPTPDPAPEPATPSPEPAAREAGPARRPEPRLLKEKARRQAKRRDADRLDR